MEFKPTDVQTEERFKPAFEDIDAILDELNRETKCGNKYLIHFLNQITNTYEGVQRVMEQEGTES